MRKHLPLLVSFTCLALIYAGLTIFIPSDKVSLTKYDISETQAKTIALTFVLPYILIWFIALYAYIKLQNYHQLIKKSDDGKALKVISQGLLALALWMSLSAIVGALTTFIGRENPDLRPTMVILSNYFNLAFVLLGTMLIYRGARCLYASVKKKGSLLSFWQQHPSSAVILLTVSGVYAFLTLTSPTRAVAGAPGERAIYYLPDWLLILTVILPSIIVWYLGFKAAILVYDYREIVPGIIYKKSLALLASGLMVTIGSFMILRYIVSVSNILSGSTLKIILAIFYIWILAIGIGYILIGLGAKKLQKLEDA